MTYWINPWEDAIPVPIEELAECHVSLGESCLNIGAGKNEKVVFILTKEKVLEHWKNAGNKLDAYILPQPSGYHSIGIRYGSDGSEYLSPAGDKEKVQVLLDKYTKPQYSEKKFHNTQALADLLDDLSAKELTDLVFYCWVNGKKVTRGQIKGFRKEIGKSR